MSKRSNGEGTISKRSSDDRWICQITLGYDEFGKAIRKACSAKLSPNVRKNSANLKNNLPSFKINLSIKNLMWIICSLIGLTKKTLTWDNIDFERNKIFVTQSVCELKNRIFIKSTKTDASKRPMIIPTFMMNILREHQKNFGTGKFVFPSLTGKNKPQAPSNICRVYRKILKMAGVKSGLYILRHTNITNLITNGTDIKTAKNRAGHTRIGTTMSYTHPSEDLERKAANIFEKFF